MANREVILITGVSGYWGGQLATRLISGVGLDQGSGISSGSDEGVTRYHVIGLDSEPPAEEIKGLDFIQADIRNNLLIDLLKQEKVNTVCHLLFWETSRASEISFDINVMGTMKILGACAEAGVRKVILRSSTSVYGAHPTNPGFITERHPLQGSRKYGYTRDLVELEAFCNGFRRQVPEMVLTILRFANIVGPKADTPLTRFLKDPWTPVLMGFDPRMQVIHERDVVEALTYAVLNEVPGVYNVAAEGIVPLSKLLALAGKIPLPVFHLCAYWGTGLMGGAGMKVSRYFPIELDYLRYAWVADLEKMRNELGFIPRYTAEEALREFAGEQRLNRYVPETAALVYDEERLRDTIERRRRMRQIEEQAAQASENLDNGALEAKG